MILDPEQLYKIANLAKLEIAEDTVQPLVEDLSRILSMVEQLNGVETEAVWPMAHPLNATQRLRQDRVTEPDKRTELQSIAPAVEDALYLVPKVIE
ncbi:MAG TPA: Asp-tRNA(Asn)/Glu-tRNA(Gln) amidotransferase GatCAB subunit C [Gammaproteobacteria bacterium]|nr:Asp-tRNA(Asn)/Glu-tRNA(Gln) amidotransferase GatCAB subunit C [Gammaproteobacteria bacterium]